ncbi:MAG TPA: ROK family protein [Xanthobacteraceae bacterium]
MAKETSAAVGLTHGSMQLPSVEVVSYNVKLTDDEGFVGDRASKKAFRQFIESWRKPMREIGEDPFGEVPSTKLAKSRLDALLAKGEPETAGVIQSAIESFALELAAVMRRFLKLKSWKDAERIVVGGGFSRSRVGELAIGRTSVLLKTDKVKTEIAIIRNDPHEAGLIGAVHLAPAWMFEAHDAILAVDIGGTNIRAGVVRFGMRSPPDMAKAKVWKFELWRHGDEKLNRDEAVDGLLKMLRRLLSRAKRADLKLAPFIGIGCPGSIEPDGSIETGAQNLPGNWESSRFNLPDTIRQAIPRIGEHETVALMHNDAVVQGLSEAPFMQDVAAWGIFTIGTGLGNAVFSNR